MILITTPNGKVGAEVTKQLLEKGVEVRVGAHTIEKAQTAFPQAHVVRFDFNDEHHVQAALDGVDAVYLGSPGPMLAAPVTRVVDHARAAGVERVVRLSAMGIEHTDTPLRQIEQHIEKTGLQWTFLRPNWFLQNYSTTNSQTIREHQAFHEPAGNAKTNFVDVRDIAAVAVQALTQDGHHGQAHTITGPQAYDRYQVAQAIATAIGKNVRYVPIEDAQLRASLAALGAPEAYVELMSNLYSTARAGWTEQVTDTVQHVLGRAPITLGWASDRHRV
jgi:uncharacterized protein YbjT (DUF2867 family)